MYFITRCIITISDGRDSELIVLVVDVLFDVPCILYTSMWGRDVYVQRKLSGYCMQSRCQAPKFRPNFTPLTCAIL